jgi:hypothetical protein
VNIKKIQHYVIFIPIASATCNISLGFIQRDINQRVVRSNPLAVYLDPVRLRINFGSQRRYDFAINRDPTAADVFLSLSPGTDPGVG